MTPQHHSKILVTGSAGFIGYHVTKKFLKEGHEVVGLDSINDYYNPQLKLDRLAELGITQSFHQWRQMLTSDLFPNLRFIRSELEDKKVLLDLFNIEKFDLVIHLAAQPGVRYSLENPQAYINSNIVGFLNLLEACRHHPVHHLVFASSSSVYGNSQSMPLSVDQNVDHPVSLYAATKKSNELMAHTYSHLFGIPSTGLRFFTVYGPWGRPDMATHLFTDAMVKGKKIKVFNRGELSRDFTYVADIVDGVYLVSQRPPGQNSAIESSDARYCIYNIGSGRPVQLGDFITTLETAMGTKVEKEYLPMQPGDVKDTYADTKSLQKDFGYAPSTTLRSGLEAFAKWYRIYYGLNNKLNHQ